MVRKNFGVVICGQMDITPAVLASMAMKNPSKIM
jgi:hypothetical protein